MIKILTIGVLLFLFYRLVFGPIQKLNEPEQTDSIESDNDDIIDIDYEDVEK